MKAICERWTAKALQAFLILALLVVTLTACTRTDPEKLLRTSIAEMESAVKARDTSKVMSFLADDFRRVQASPSSEGMTKPDARRVLAAVLLTNPNVYANGTISALTTYSCTGKEGADALGQYTAEGFVVFKNSKARKRPVESLQAYPSYVARRQALINSRKLVDANETLTFTEDVLFSSPSAAADMVLGRSSNGWIDWVTEDGRTLDSVERNQP
jgi:hypothetical protein